jgi:hypothetical protein
MRSAKRFLLIAAVGGCLLVIGAAPQARADALDDLAKRVQVLEDRETIRELILAYGAAHDIALPITLPILYPRRREYVAAHGTAERPEPIYDQKHQPIGQTPAPDSPLTIHEMEN